VSDAVTPGTGALAGFDIHRFFYAFNASSPPGVSGATRLQSVSLFLQTTTTFKWLEGQFALPDNGPGNPDIDPFGIQGGDAAYRTENTGETTGTGVFVHDPDSDPWIVQRLILDGVSRPFTSNDSSATNNPRALFGPVRGFSIGGSVPNPPGGLGGDPAALVQSSPYQEGAGALFAMVIVPTGNGLGGIGQVAADAGPVLIFEIPEPGALVFVGLAGLALGRRRRRRG
jgi:MYXO-CTERM domain-containing protein